VSVQTASAELLGSRDFPTHIMSCISSKASALSSDNGFIRMTVDDLSYTPSAEEVTRHADQRIATGRRSWRMLKGKPEAVWPPNLSVSLYVYPTAECLIVYHREAALLEGAFFPM
jgi:hypothetical protein